MSTEKLSELSNPVAWFTDDYLTDKSATTYSEEVSQRWRDKPWFVGNLYSQECVSALLARIAELEAKLATPVRLPRPACTYADHSYPAYSRKQVEGIITSAGMRFTVEGDE